MPKYLEDYNNDIVQVFDCFYTFLYCATHDYKKDEAVHNIIVLAKNTFTRELCDFFGEKNPKYDDWNYRDFLLEEKDFNFICSKEFRVFLNKGSLHISKKRGIKLKQPTQREYAKTIISLKNCIVCFLDELKQGNINPQFIEQYKDEVVKEYQAKIYSLLQQEGLNNFLNDLVVC